MLDAAFPCMNSGGEQSAQPNGSTLGLLVHAGLFPQVLYANNTAQQWDPTGRTAELTTRGCVLGAKEEPQACLPAHSGWAEVSPSWRGLGECSWSAEDLLFTKICLSPEWLPLCSASVITSQRKHWAPKRFQAVNSRIVLTRARPNIWEQIAATPRSCLHQQPAHEAAPHYFI